MKLTPYFFLLFLLISCAGQKLIVRNADTLLEYQVNKRIPLNSEQEDKLAKDVDTFLNNQKKTAEEILVYVKKLDLNQPSHIEKDFLQIQSYYNAISFQFTELIAGYLPLLNSKQREEFYSNLKEELKNSQKKSPAERLEERREKIERFSGELNQNQLNILNEFKDAFDEKIVLKEKLHASLKELLEKQTPPQEKSKQIASLYQHHQEQMQKLNQTLEIIQKLAPTTTNSQKQHLQEKIGDVKEVLQYFIQMKY